MHLLITVGWQRSSRMASALAGLAIIMTASPLQAALPAKPNVLVILCDDLGYGDLECYGHPTIKTPHLNRLASQGIRFTSCYSASPVCSPSRAGLLTGRTPNRTGVYDWIPAGHVMHLPPGEVTVATLLKRAGYQTAHVGKWHLNGKFNSPLQPQPGDHGFDHWFSTQNNAAPSHKNPINFVRNGKPIGPLQGFSCQLVVDEAISWLESRDSDQPFFLYVCFHEPHEPIASPQPLVAEYLSQAGNEDEAQYFANVANLDNAVGRLMAAIHNMSLDPSTLILFTSDNGPETLKRYPKAQRSYGSPGELRGMKLWLYEGGIRVAGILRWTDQVEAGQIVAQPISSLDLLPTLCELAELEPPAERPLDGTSITPILHGEELARQTPLAWFYYRALGEPKASMRHDDWTILGHRLSPKPENGGNVNPKTQGVIHAAVLGDFELYNLTSDPQQKINLAKQQPDKTEKLSQLLIDRHNRVKAEAPVWTFQP